MPEPGSAKPRYLIFEPMKTITHIAVFLWLTVSVATANAEALPDFAPLVEANGPAVVNISTTQSTSPHAALPPGLEIPDLPEDSPFHDFFRRFFEDQPEQFDVKSLGSGFIVSSDGYILTCAHVIDNAKEIVVRLTDRRELEAKVVGLDRRSDVALLKIEATGLPTLEIGDPGRLKVGEWVLAIGSPFGFDSTATAGIVSAKGRSLPNESYVPYIQTDVAINPGNSGGPLFNLEGKVVGINAQIYSRTGGFMGLSFAVPIDLAMEVAEQLKREGHVTRGWLGVTIQDVTRELAESFEMKKPQGALVADVLADSPASHSDLKVGDVIVEYEGSNIGESSDLPPLVGTTPVGTSARLKVIRDGKPMMVRVTIGELPPDEAQEQEQRPEKPAADTVLGMTLRDLSAKELEERGIENGVLVTNVEPGAAAEAEIRRNDVIMQFDRKPVSTVKELRELVAELPSGRTVPVLVRRGGGSLFLVVKLP
jgi:serine protease Do